MQAQAYEGYFENGKFYTAGRIVNIPERQRVYIRILEEPITDNENAKAWQEFSEEIKYQKIKDEDQELRIKWLEKLNTAIGLSLNEELPDIPRSTLMREPIGLSD